MWTSERCYLTSEVHVYCIWQQGAVRGCTLELMGGPIGQYAHPNQAA